MREGDPDGGRGPACTPFFLRFPRGRSGLKGLPARRPACLLEPHAPRPGQRADIRAAFAVAAEPHESAVPLDWEDTTCPALWRTFDGEHRYRWSDWYDPDTKNVYWR